MLHNKAGGVGALFHSKRVLDIIVAPAQGRSLSMSGGKSSDRSPPTDPRSHNVQSHQYGGEGKGVAYTRGGGGGCPCSLPSPTVSLPTYAANTFSQCFIAMTHATGRTYPSARVACTVCYRGGGGIPCGKI